MEDILIVIEQFIKAILTSQLLFLLVICISIIWQQQNSKRLADEAGQLSRQAKVFSWLISLAIFISVANDMMYVAYSGVICEMLINCFLVFSDREKVLAEIKTIDNKLVLYSGMQKKGIEIVQLKNDRIDLVNKTNTLAIVIRVFIAALMPLSLLVLSHLYIGEN